MRATLRIFYPALLVVFYVSLGALAADLSTDIVAPDGWRTTSPRDEISPMFEVQPTDNGQYALVIAGADTEATYGWWVRDYEVAAGKSYAFRVAFSFENIPLPRRSVLARLTRFDADGKKLRQPEYPATVELSVEKGTGVICGTYDMPADCVRVRVELVLRWVRGGRVEWRDVSLEEAPAVEPRVVRVATIRYRPAQRTSGPDENRKLFAAMVTKAAKQRPDIIVLGEGITVVSTGMKYVDVAESVPGPTSKRFGELSRAHDCYIVAGIYERDGEVVYNTSLLMGPGGEVVGKYRKTCIPREESEGGLMPGDEYPVFDTRFGKVGMMICWDVHFPEVARRLAINGAELICLPIWGGNDKLAQARAIENQVYLATSSYNTNIRSAIFDPHGDALATATDEDPIAVVEIDLNKQNLHGYLGDFKARIPRERPAGDGETCFKR